MYIVHCKQEEVLNTNNSQDSQSDDETTELTESSSLPFLSLVELITVFLAANLILLRRK